jgi:hypothetical protein
MAYLIPIDYQVNIQDVNIQQIINNDETIRDRAQLSGEAEAKSYLKQKYDISREFQNLLPFNYNRTYYAFERFYFDADEYQSTSNYVINDLTLYDGDVYICINNTTGTFIPADWSLIGAQYTLAYVNTPYPEFEYGALYNIGDMVFWKNKTYQCKVQTAVLDHDTALQYREIKDLPLPNVAPDDPISGLQYWGVGAPYSVLHENPNDTTFFTKGDNRDPQMVLYLCDMVLYHLHTRIAPRNIPDLRVKRYDDAIAWLRMCAEGSVTPNLPLIKPKQGNRIRFGGYIRQINSY